MKPRPLSLAPLAAITACLAAALAAHWGSLPAWVFAVVAVSAGLRLMLAHRGRAAPPRGVRLVISLLAIGVLYLQFRTFNGLSAGTALLALMAGLKLLETDTQRDIYVVILLIYFVCVSALLQGDSFWLLAYLIAVCWLTTAALLRLTTTQPVPAWRPSLRYAGRMLAQALPLALVCWLLFPRFAAPLWQIPGSTQRAASGLSDTMNPGGISELALSDEVAFRVRYSGAAPPPGERYWRGPVMHDFDGRTWSRGYSASLRVPAPPPQGAAYTYTLSLEPHRHNWIFALDWPAHWDLPRGALRSDYTLVMPEPVSRPIDVVLTSNTRLPTAEPLSDSMRRSDLRLPPHRNPRTLRLAQALRGMHADDAGYVRAVLDMFSQQAFYYTLTPPKFDGEEVDEFLFDSKRGFCGHYASAFATLMRAAGIPARVVTGYQGGTFNRFANYWILRQSDAHAWDEVWIGRGWLRVDPTAAIAPSRVEHDLGDAAGADEPLAGRWQRRTPWLADMRLRLDALRQLWRERILLFDQDSQQRLLASLHIPEPDGQKLVAVLGCALVLVLGWLTWTVRREVDPARREPLIRAYARLCARLAAVGLPRRAHEGAEDYAARVSRSRPDLAPAVTALCRHYTALRYADSPARITVKKFTAAVRAFRPARATRRE